MAGISLVLGPAKPDPSTGMTTFPIPADYGRVSIEWQTPLAATCLQRFLLTVLCHGGEQRFVVVLHLRIRSQDRGGDRRHQIDIALRLLRRQGDDLAAVLFP